MKCNPNAFAKLVDNKCVCTYPYKGTECEECERGYNAVTNGKHPICLLDKKVCSQDYCNRHGDCLEKGITLTCKCQDKYMGLLCDQCKDPQYAYPDCEDILADIYQEQSEKDYLLRRQYNQDGYQKSKIDSELLNDAKKPQCQFANYPRDLDRVEFMDFLQGDFHIADFYTINHDQDNIMRFTPKKQGTIKILLQQPELEEIAVNDESFDLEIALYDLERDKFVASSMNQFFDFENKQIKGKVDYSSLQVPITQELVNKTMYLMFRAVNFTAKDSEVLAECENAYIEIEFREKERTCDYNAKAEESAKVIQVDANSPY